MLRRGLTPRGRRSAAAPAAVAVVVALALALLVAAVDSSSNGGVVRDDGAVGHDDTTTWTNDRSLTSEGPRPSRPRPRPRRRTSYTRPAYPEYCSIPETMERRSIPPVTQTSPSSNTGLQTQLLQTTAVIRHGARTPWAPLTCWEDYDTLSQGGKWDCTLRSVMAPTRHPKSSHENGMFLFEKRYDALKYPLHNRFNGTCLMGQLIDEGYDMELTNGRHLREAYIETNSSHMRLFETAQYERRPYEDSTYFRADNEQRTLMSGQILVSGLFDVDGHGDTVMPLHTADYDVDVLTPNERICPRLTDLKSQALASAEYWAKVESAEVKELMRTVRERLRPDDFDRAMDCMIDCLMTTYCTDRPLPDVIDDFKSDGDGSVFSRLYEYSVWRDTFHYTYNDGSYAKLGMGPLWSEIHRPLKRTKRASSLEDMKDWNLPRLLLFSGHDTTLMPLLATLGEGVWDGTWMPYASMVIIESHAVTSGSHPDFPSEHAFRLIFNGEVITQRIKGCTAELCDLDVLLNQIEPFATLERDCDSSTTSSTTSELRQWVRTGRVPPWVTVLVSLACGFVGALITFVGVTGRMPFSKRYCCPQRAYDSLDPHHANGEKAIGGHGHDATNGASSTVDECMDTGIEVTDPVTEESNGVEHDTRFVIS